MKLISLISFFSVFIFSYAYPAEEEVIRSYIAGGKPAQEGQFPFQVGLQTHYLDEDKDEHTQWCGGSLIAENVVLTAAHCVHNGFMAEVFLGVVDLAKNPLVINVTGEGIIEHEKYKDYFADHDIAVVILPQNVGLTDKIQTVNLPRKSQKYTDFAKSVGWISGWGKLGDTKGSTEKLQFARRWILTDDFCQHHFPEYKKDIEICVDGSHGISACNGDSGGPLTIVEKDGSRTLLGVTSYGKFVCEEGFPTVYTRVIAYLEWIAEKTGIILKE